MIYEIRNYYYEPTQIAAYKVWAKTKAMALSETQSQRPRVLGQHRSAAGGHRAPDGRARVVEHHVDHRLGRHLRKRKATLDRVFATPEWQKIFADVPGGIASYLRIECKFTESLT